MPATIDIDCTSISDNKPLYRYHRKQIRLRDTSSRPLDHANLASWGTDAERCFVRLHEWVPSALSGPFGGAIPHAGLDTDPNPNFTYGDSWINDQNSRDTPVSVWVTHEDLNNTSWFPTNPGLSDYLLYEDTLYEILRYLHTVCNNVVIFEPLNEPEIAVNGPNGTVKWTVAQQYEICKTACRAIARVNAEFGLTGEAQYKTAFPNWTEAAFSSGEYEDFIDLCVADSEWDSVVKPTLGYWSIHGFQNTTTFAGKVTDFELMDSYISISANPNLLQNIPRAITAYNLSGDTNYSPTDLEMARHAAFFMISAKHFNDYEGPNGERMQEAIMFAQNNYNDYNVSSTSPIRLNANPSWTFDVNGVKTPVGNAFWMLDKAGDNSSSARRLDVSGSGSNSWEVNDPAGKKGVTAEAIYNPGSNKIHILVGYSVQTLDNTPRTMTINLNTIGDILAADASYTLRRWQLDRNTSKVGTYASGGIELVETTSISGGTNPQFSFDTIAPGINLIEIEASGPADPGPSPTGSSGWGTVVVG